VDEPTLPSRRPPRPSRDDGPHILVAAVVVAWLLEPAAALGADPPPCPGTENLAAQATASSRGATGDLSRLVGKRWPDEGSGWDHPAAVKLAATPEAAITLDLGRPFPLAAVALQADNNDTYRLEVSDDGASFRLLREAEAVSAPGLRTRAFRVVPSVPARWVRLVARGGDGRYAVSGIALHCVVPSPWPPATRSAGADAAAAAGPWLTEARIDAIKAATALLGLVVVLWAIAVRRAGRPDADRRPRRALLVVAAAAAAFGWGNFFRFHYDNHLHYWEHFHYYLGAKYARELGYERLYACVAVADIEAGLGGEVRAGKIRDLRTNRIVPVTEAEAVRDPRACTSRFSPARWADFKRDVAYFRGRLSARWGDLRQDHGYNASPVWALAGSTLANIAPASDETLLALALVDPLLLAVLFVLVGWAFGLEALCLALVFFGTNHAARYAWNGGAFLRMDWLCASVAAICLVRRGRPLAGGFALGTAALLRLFPALLASGLVLKVIVRSIRERRLALSREHRRFGLGVLASVALLVPLSLAAPGSSWTEFIHNTRKHEATWATNHVGLRTVLGYSYRARGSVTFDSHLEEPWSVWKQEQARRFDARRWAFALGLLLFAALLALRVEREDDADALVLGIGFIPVATYLASYYAAVLLGLALLYRPRREWTGALLCALSIVTWLVALEWSWFDERYFWTSLAILGTVLATVLAGAGTERPAQG
jgi:hypothetical protein